MLQEIRAMQRYRNRMATGRSKKTDDAEVDLGLSQIK